MENTEQLEEFRQYLKKKNLSANTIISYMGSVRLYQSLYSELTRDHLLSYRAHLISHYKASTINQRIYAINHYIHFVGGLPDNNRLPSVKTQRHSYLDQVISNEDYEHFKMCLKADGQTFWYFVIRFLAATGARISELLQIKIEHVRLGYLDLYSKGGKIRRLYFPDILCQETLDWCHKKELTSGFLFLNQKGKRITARGISYQLKHFAWRYGIDPDTVYPHSFRHRFAKNFLEHFNDISLLADLMGHESIETTRIYLTRSSSEQQALLDELITW